MLQAHHAPDFGQHQRQIHNQPRRVEVDFQQPPRGVRTQQKHQQQAQEAGRGHAPRPPQQDKEVVQHKVQHRARQHGKQRARAALIHHVDAVQELVQAGQHRAERQKRHKGPRIKILGLENPHQQLAQHNNARHAAEQHAGIHTENLGEKRLAVGLLRHGGKLPRLIENAAQNRDNLRQEVPRRQQADPVVAAAAAVALAHTLHKEHIAGVDDPEADGRGDHRQAVAQHILPQRHTERLGLEVAPAPARDKDKHHRGQVRQRVGQQKAGCPQLEHAEENQVIRQQAERGQHAVNGHQPVHQPRPYKLGTQRAQAACQHAEVQKAEIFRGVGYQPHQRHGQQQHQKAHADGGRTVDKDAGFVIFLIQTKPDDRICHAKADHRNQQVGGLLQQAGHAHNIR